MHKLKKRLKMSKKISKITKNTDEWSFRPPAVVPRRQNLNDGLYATVNDVSIFNKSTDDISNKEGTYEEIGYKDMWKSPYEEVLKDTYKPVDDQIYAKLNKQVLSRRSSTLPKNSSSNKGYDTASEPLYSSIRKILPNSSTKSIYTSMVASFEDSVFNSKAGNTTSLPRWSPVNSRSPLLSNSPLASPRRRRIISSPSSTCNFEKSARCVSISPSRSPDRVVNLIKHKRTSLNFKNVKKNFKNSIRQNSNNPVLSIPFDSLSGKDNSISLPLTLQRQPESLSSSQKNLNFEATQRPPPKISIKNDPLKMLPVKDEYVVRNPMKRNLQKSRRRKQAAADNSFQANFSPKFQTPINCLNNSTFETNENVIILSVNEDISFESNLFRGMLYKSTY